MKNITVVIPCYNEEETVHTFYNEIKSIANSMKDCVEFDLLFINDGSRDRTLEILKELHSREKQVNFISFSRNFGKESAVFAGMENAKGDYVIVMDVDLQDPPSLIPKMFEYITEGYDCVATRRSTRKGEPPIRSLFAKIFYKIMGKISKTEVVDGARDYRLMSRQMVNAIISMKEYNRFLKGIYGWVGFETKWISYDNIERSAGQTKWSFWKLLIYSVEGIIAFSTAPLAVISVSGVFLCIFAFLALFIIVLRAFIYGDPVAGWPSIVSCIIFLGGIQLLCMGVIGLYISKSYLEVKNRPIYIIKEKSDS